MVDALGIGSPAREGVIDLVNDPVDAGRKQHRSLCGIVVAWVWPDNAPQWMRWVMSRCRPRIIVRVLLSLRWHAADVDPFRPKRAKQGRFKHPGVIGAERRAFTSSIDSASAFVLWSAPIPCCGHRLYRRNLLISEVSGEQDGEADAQCFEALQLMRNTPSISAAPASSPSTDRRHGRRECRNTAGGKRCLRRARRLEDKRRVRSMRQHRPADARSAIRSYREP
jgi:hypothetical protein